LKLFNRLSLWILLASATFSVMAGSIIAPILNLMREGLGVDQASVGLIITTHGLFIALSSPLIGNLIDKIGTKKPYIFGLILYGLAGGSGLIVKSYWVLLFSRAILGIGVAAFFTSITVMILNLYKGIERDKIMGWRGSANSFGGIIWPLVGGFLGTFSWHLPFAVYLLAIPLGFCALITVPETHQEQNQEKDKITPIWKIFRDNPIILAIYGLIFSTMILLYTIVVFLPQLLEKIGISNPVYIGLFFSIMMLSAGLTSLNYGRIKAKFSYKTVVLLALSLWTMGLLMISLVFSSFIAVASIALIGVGQGLLLPAISVWVGEITDSSFRGRVVSYIGTFGFFGQFSSPIIFSPVSLFFGLRGVFLVGGMISALLFLLFLIGMRK
jgi:ACDE family multidrug resistance protein